MRDDGRHQILRDDLWNGLPAETLSLAEDGGGRLLGIGTVYDPFAGRGSTLAAAQALGYRGIGTERSAEYCALAESAFPTLSTLGVDHRLGHLGRRTT